MSSENREPSDWSSPGEWACIYRDLGLAAIPAVISTDGKKKHPFGSWKEFQENGIPQTVHDRWYAKGGTHVNEYTMGFLTGAACFGPGEALLVIDVDVKDGKNGLRTWGAWIKTHNSGIEIETWTAITGSGGIHYYFKFPSELKVTNTQETIDGIDVRGHGGFIMAPPSPHYTPQKSYEWKHGFAPWDTEIADAPGWLLEIVMSISELSLARTARITQTASPDRCQDVFGNDIDGRDKKMADVAYAAMLDAYRLCPIRPSSAEIDQIIDRAYSAYTAHTGSRLDKDGRSKDDRLEAEGRGLSAMREKILRHYRSWDSYLAQAARTAPRHILEKKLEAARKGDKDDLVILKQMAEWWSVDGHPDAGWLQSQIDGLVVSDPISHEKINAAGSGPTPSSAPLEVLSEADLDAMPPPQWLVEDFLFEDAWGYIWGMPGTGKSFIALDIAAHIAYGMDKWHHGKRINLHGDVLYLVQEGVRGFGKRLAAFRKKHGLVDYSDRIRLIRTNLNFMDAGDITKLIDTIKAEQRDFKLIVVDTFSRVLPGAEENAQEDMTLFIAASNKVREITKATLLGVHHANFSGERERGSTTMRGAADFVFQVSKTAGEMAVEVTCNKMKDDEDGWKKEFKMERVTLSEGSLGIKETASLVLTAADAEEGSSALDPTKAIILEMVQAHREAGHIYNRTGAGSLVSRLRKHPPLRGISNPVLNRCVEELEADGELDYGLIRAGNGVRGRGYFVAGTEDFNQ